MRTLLSGIGLLITTLLAAQSKTTIRVTDQNGAPVPNATIEIEKTGLFVASEQGVLSITTRETGLLNCRVSSVGYTTVEKKLSLPDPSVVIVLERTRLFLDAVEIRALRAGNKAPFAKTNLGRGEIEKLNLGQDLPFILNQTPSVTVTSDAGNGIGYTGIRIRGTDATRINVTINGIPYNDAESQGTYFVDIPDIASSLNSIQIQRGVGTSSNGAGAFGASINLSTNDYNDKPYAEVNNSFGSFNTWKSTVKLGTGLINNHFTVDARLSRVASDGFIDRAGTRLNSFYLGAAYYSGKSSLRFNIISGKEKTYQAWNGIPEYKIFYNKDSLLQHYYNNLGYLYNNTADSLNLFNSNPRKYNVFTYPNQTDNYQQDHYQLFFNHHFNNDWSLNTALYLSKGKGYYEEYKTGASFGSYGLPDVTIGTETITNTDLVRQLWLDNNLYGTILSLMHKTSRDQLTIGGGWNEYDGKHYGYITWAQLGVPDNYRWYNYKSWKKDGNAYAKYQYKITPQLEALADVQYRRVTTHINGTRNFPDLKVDKSYNFFNPKLGLTWSFGALSAYASYAIANKEPNNDDYETGSAVNPPNREQLHDFELGLEKSAFNYSWGI
ncbi:MAG TPA: TonB-dependent receptor plug domain-containing protein, partial [Chitinophagaceae bacterium]|nr:TonB-dependent receptor plug domain-containing protein [Chitinophagaceae bacterium]